MKTKAHRVLEKAKAKGIEVELTSTPGRITTVIGAPPPPSEPEEKDGKEDGDQRDS